jgi:hypothetical protein
VEGRADAGVAAPALELGGNDFGVVEHQHVAGVEQRRQVEHRPVGDGRAANGQQPRRIARARWAQRDTLGRKLEIELVDAHRGVV